METSWQQHHGGGGQGRRLPVHESSYGGHGGRPEAPHGIHHGRPFVHGKPHHGGGPYFNIARHIEILFYTNLKSSSTNQHTAH